MLSVHFVWLQQRGCQFFSPGNRLITSNHDFRSFLLCLWCGLQTGTIFSLGSQLTHETHWHSKCFLKYDAVGFLLFDLPHCLIHFVSYCYELLINLLKLAVGFDHIQGVACSQRNLEIHISVYMMNINIPVCGDCVSYVQAPLLFHLYTNCSLLNASISSQVWLLSSCNLITINLNRSAFHGFYCLKFQ